MDHVYTEIARYLCNKYLNIYKNGIKSCISTFIYNVCIATKTNYICFVEAILLITFSLLLCCKPLQFVLVLRADSLTTFAPNS